MSDDAGTSEECLAHSPAEREAHAFQRLFTLAGDPDRSFAETVEAMLEVGREWFDTPYGYLAATDEDLNIVVGHGDRPELERGSRIPLDTTYCRYVEESGSLVAINDAEAEGYGDDPTYEEFGIRCYIGTAVEVNGEQFGTLCFMGHDAREVSFSEEDKAFLESLADWMGTELEGREQERELQRRGDRLTEFPGFVAHELRNPLAVALGQLELDDPNLETVHGALERMDTRIESLLTLARSEQPVTDSTHVAIETVARNAWNDLGFDSSALVIESDRTVMGDPQRVRTLVENLLKNAHVHAGSDATVTLRETTEGFAIDDDGPGIPADEREAIFERGHTTGSGTGLGLAIVDRIAEAHGWHAIAAESPDGGARIEIQTRVRGEEY